MAGEHGAVAFLDGLGTRARSRPAPRLSIALAAAGCGLAVLGSLLVGGDGLGGGDDDGSRLPGVLVSALVVAAGYALLQRQRAGGPVATAGTVAAALGVPPLLFFLTFDEGDLPPYSTDAVLFVSTVAWASTYVVGPGRGRPFFLGAACVGLWLAIIQATEGLLDFPFAVFGTFSSFGDDGFGSGSAFGFDSPDPMAIGGLSLAFGAGYLLVARALDRRGYAGTATALTVAALLALPFGVVFVSDELEAVGAGLLGMAVGTAVAGHGASVGRRATTWLGAAGAAVAAIAVVGDVVDEPTPGGVALMLVGAAAVAGAEALRRATDEPGELDAPDRPAAALER